MIRLFRHALRQLRGNPGFAFTAILTLTIGIGATTAIFAVLDAVLLEPLPFAQPDRLVAVESQPYNSVSIPTMQDYLARSTTFASMAAYSDWSPGLKAYDATAPRKILIVSQGFFSTLGSHFAIGHGWPTTGNEQDCSSTAVVSGGYWKRLGGGNQLGRKILNLDGRDYQISGVLQAEEAVEGEGGFGQPDVYVQIGCDSQAPATKRGWADFSAVGRLKPGATIAQATADLVRIDALLLKEYPQNYRFGRSASARLTTAVIPYVELMVGRETKPTLYLTFAACGLLLLIACANLANLMLARNTRRRAEFATRATLGATPGQLLQQLLVESAVLVTLGATGGVLLATVIIQLLKNTAALHVPRLAHASISLPVILFAVTLSAAVALFLALLPAWRTLRPGLLRDLQGTGRSSAGRSLRVAGRLLVIAQITLTLVLVACAGWMIGSVYLLLHQPLGFVPAPLLMAQASLGASNATREQNAVTELKFTQVAEALHQLPGVVSVALTMHPPLGHYVDETTFCTDLHPEQCRKAVNEGPNASMISPDYFATVGQSILEGRDFNDADDGRNHVVIVNQAIARREWQGESALGHRVRTGEIKVADGSSLDDMPWATVVGVVGNVKDRDLETAPRPDLYVPRADDPRHSVMFILKANGDPALLLHAVRERIKAQLPSARVFGVRTMQEEMLGEVREKAFLMRVAIAFGGVALFLSILGTYGLLAYEVSLREKEIGIRLALGSSRERIVALLLHEEGRWLVAGGMLGLAGAAATGYALRSRFYQAQATSMPVLIGSTVLLLVPALIAIGLPASHAALQDPAETLRRE